MCLLVKLIEVTMDTGVMIVFALQVLANIATFALQIPSLFASYFEEFFVRSCDTDPIRALKLDVLTTIATESSIHTILHEFQVDRFVLSWSLLRIVGVVMFTCTNTLCVSRFFMP